MVFQKKHSFPNDGISGTSRFRAGHGRIWSHSSLASMPSLSCSSNSVFFISWKRTSKLPNYGFHSGSHGSTQSAFRSHENETRGSVVQEEIVKVLIILSYTQTTTCRRRSNALKYHRAPIPILPFITSDFVINFIPSQRSATRQKRLKSILKATSRALVCLGPPKRR